ncbi:MAG TPA: hypothetical protein VJM11_14465, partial [Nevskiaceae bacterium]|nr:hypothetical protein [Nevskiaceae bacterium]
DMAALLGHVCAAVAQVDPGLRIVAKLHPAERADTQAAHAALASAFPDVHFLFRAHMTELVERAAAVVTINSTVGFEAILLDRPVVALGRNFYITPGVVEVVEDLAALPHQLARALDTPIDRERRRALLRFVTTDFLAHGSYDDCREQSVQAIARRIVERLSPLLGGAVADRPVGVRATPAWAAAVTS